MVQYCKQMHIFINVWNKHFTIPTYDLKCDLNIILSSYVCCLNIFEWHIHFFLICIKLNHITKWESLRNNWISSNTTNIIFRDKFQDHRFFVEHSLFSNFSHFKYINWVKGLPLVTVFVVFAIANTVVVRVFVVFRSRRWKVRTIA